MVNTTKRTALITGASSGIGLELCRILAKNDFNLVLVARSKKKLEELAEEITSLHSVEVLVLPEDLSDPTAPKRILNALSSKHILIHILVNNAGFGVHGPFVSTSIERECEMIGLNILALTRLTKLFLPGMLSRGEGAILNVASTGAFQPGPFIAAYFATKAYVLSLTEAIAAEVAGSGVKISALCPGPTRTGFQKAARMEGSRMFGKINVLDAQRVAQEGYRGLISGKRMIIPGLLNKILYFATRLFPRRTVMWAVKGLFRNI
ncbi:MAG: SDR family oxidoreductase [Candidatus Poribacteria bacterium]